MKIALLGYGKMGRAIEQIARGNGHQIGLRRGSRDGYDKLETADVAIDFSVPLSAVVNISTCLNMGIPVISGTTGWLDDFEIITAMCEEKNGAFIYGSN